MKAATRTAFLLFSILLAAHQHNYCLAQVGEISAETTGLITLYVGEIKALPTTNPRRVMISQPNVADVASISKDEMLIAAKASGATDLIWWDSQGEHRLELKVFAEDLKPIKERIDSILKELNLPDVYTRSMDSEGKVLLLGSVKAAQDRERIAIASKELKSKIVDLIQVKEEETMVGIDVQVLELSKDATTTLGFNRPGSINLTEKSSSGISTAGSKWGTLFKVLNVNRDAFTWTLDALVQEGKARILSQPQLACQSGKEAELLVGGEKPILTTTVAATTGAQATNVDYKEFGIKLKIKPTVTDNKQIKLTLNVEVSEAGTAEILGSVKSPTAKAYPLTKRNASTELFLTNGQTMAIMAIGGLKKQKSEEDIRKAPFLGDVPILGLLFRKRTSKTGGGEGGRGDVELFITLTPTIMQKEASKEEVVPKEEANLEAPAVPEETIIKEEAEPEVEAKAKPAKKIKPKKIKKEKVKKETEVKETPEPEAQVMPGVEVEPVIGAGGGGAFPKGIIPKEALKPKAEAEVKTKVARAPKGKARKAKKAEKEAKVKVSLKEGPSADKATFEAKTPASAQATASAAPTLSPQRKETKAEPAAKPKPQISVSVEEAITIEEAKSKEPSEEEIDADALAKYLAKIAQLIRDNLVYPWIARQMNMQGSLILGIHLENTGQLLGVEVKRPSGCALLDDDAVRTVKRIAPYPPFPPGIKRKELHIDLPIIYKIE